MVTPGEVKKPVGERIQGLETVSAAVKVRAPVGYGVPSIFHYLMVNRTGRTDSETQDPISHGVGTARLFITRNGQPPRALWRNRELPNMESGPVY
jgi:hypothetical protein